MHDGSVKTLADVVALYEGGGVKNPTLDVFVMPLGLSDDEQKDLVAFLEALTGTLPKIERPTLPK
jgi:cytochrome c peroxidase